MNLDNPSLARSIPAYSATRVREWRLSCKHWDSVRMSAAGGRYQREEVWTQDLDRFNPVLVREWVMKLWRTLALTRRVAQLRRATHLGAGFTLVEIMIVLVILGLFAAIIATQSRRPRELAILHACIVYEAALNKQLWTEFALSGNFPNSFDVIAAQMPPAGIEATFSYIGGEDMDLGHGNDGDGNDADNPAGGDPTFAPSYYIRCEHDHSYLGVLFVDSGAQLPPLAIYDLADARGDMPVSAGKGI